MINLMDTADRVLRLRKSLQLTQTELGEKAGVRSVNLPQTLGPFFRLKSKGRLTC